MKLHTRRLFLLFALLLAACSGKAPAETGPVELPPTPYPDTPSPARIDAPLVEAPAMIELEMFNELEGWAVTDAEIARTNDGAITWYNVSPPDVIETGYSIDSFFLDSGHAWVQKPDLENFPNSGTLYRTTDGGQTWTEHSVPFSRGDLHFVDAEHGWMLADLGVGAGSNAVAVFQTNNGGATWQKKYTNDPNDAHAADSLPLGGLKSDILPLDMNNAWVTGVVYAPGEVYLFHTGDGGVTWKQVTLPLPPGAENFELGIDDGQMQFVSPTEGYIALRMSGDRTEMAVYTTRDAGNSWSLSPTLLDGAGPSSFLTAQEVVIYNGRQFNVTRDAAQSWQQVTPDVAFGEAFAALEFVNLMSGWVITMDPSTNQRSLYRTLDGGATWLPAVP